MMDNFHKMLRLNVWLRHSGGGKFLSKILWRFMRFYYSCDIPPTIICNDVYFAHSGFGCMINEKAQIGRGTVIQHSVTIGEVHGKVPSIGNNCYVGARVVIIGDVKVGDGSVIGAGAVVTKDVPPHTIVGGVPAKVIKYRK